MDEMQPHDARSFLLIEVAGNGVSNHVPQRVEAISFGDDRLSHRTSDVATLGRFFDHKDEFGAGHRSRVPSRPVPQRCR